MNNKQGILLISVISLAITFFFQFPAIFDYYTINDDVRVESFIFFKSLDASLFENNLQAEWVNARNPIGYKIIYILGTSIFHDPIIFGKALTFILALILGIFCFKLGCKINKKVGWGFFFLFSFQIWVFPSLSGGMSRAFAYPLIVAFIYYLIERDFLKISIVMILQLILYPISILISLTVLMLVQINKENYLRLKKKIVTKELKVTLLLIMLFSILILSFYSYPQSDYLELVDQEKIKQDPIYANGGRKEISPPPTLFFLLEKYCLITFILSLILLPYYIRNKKNKVPKELFLLGLTGLMLYLLAIIFLPQFYYPSRYIRYSLPLFFSFFVASQLGVFVDNLNLAKITKRTLYFIVVVLICLLILPTTKRDLIRCDDDGLYDFLKEKDSNILVAGHPYDTPCIPTFAKRNVLVSHESLYPIYINYYKIMEKRLNDLFTAYYSGSYEIVHHFCMQYNITYIVVNKNHYPGYRGHPMEENGFVDNRYYIEPFNSKIKQLIGDRTNFYLINNSHLIYLENNISLYPCQNQ